jgi:hypothetical protein
MFKGEGLIFGFIKYDFYTGSAALSRFLTVMRRDASTSGRRQKSPKSLQKESEMLGRGEEVRYDPT